jgi:hypothetical protein
VFKISTNHVSERERDSLSLDTLSSVLYHLVPMTNKLSILGIANWDKGQNEITVLKEGKREVKPLLLGSLCPDLSSREPERKYRVQRFCSEKGWRCARVQTAGGSLLGLGFGILPL